MGSEAVSLLIGRSRQSVVNYAHRLGINVLPDVANRLREKGLNHEEGDRNNNWKGGKKPNNYYKKRSEARYPEKAMARAVYNRERRAGRIDKLPCVVCGNPMSEAHHEDYTKPLNIIWLCRKHHVIADRKLKKGSIG